MRDRANEYNQQATGIYQVVVIEQQKGIIELNGENNKKILGDKVLNVLLLQTYPNYQSMGRTLLRIMRFFNYLKIMFSEIDMDRNQKISDACSKAYMQALYPYHSYSLFVMQVYGLDCS